MSFRNISAWSIRNPVPSIVLFMMLTVAGIVSFIRMDINDEPDIEFPAAVVIDQPAGRRADRAGDPGHPARRGGGPLDRGGRRDPLERHRRAIRPRSSSSPSARRSTARVNDVRDAISQIRGDLPDGILEPQIERVKINDNDLGILYRDSAPT